VNGRRIMASAKVEQRGGLIGKTHLVFTYGSIAKGNRWGGAAQACAGDRAAPGSEVMPTGYTAGVADGTITELTPFALQLARGMGALIMMRDDAWDAPIPERFEPNTYHAEQLAALRDELARLIDLSPEEAQERADAAFAEAQATKQKYIAEKHDQRARYKAMLDKVVAWEGAPDGLKDFALQQLNEGMRFDCGEGRDFDFWPDPERFDGETWRSTELERVGRQIGSHARENAAERQRVGERNVWIAQLRKSLAMESGG
jgi:hypothetical protein